MTETGLPRFNAGDPLEKQLTETKMNALVARIRRNTPLQGKGIRITQTESGSTINILDKTIPHGSFDNPYTLESLIYGSSTLGPGGVGGSTLNFDGGSDGHTPWGGSADTPTDTTLRLKDQWHRERPPLDGYNLSTRGALSTIQTRIERTNANTYSLYGRDYTHDTKGALVLIDVENDPALIKSPMHPWQVYVTALSTNSCSVKINPNSTLMQTYSYRSSWSASLWKDAWTHANITNFSNTFTLTASDHCVWMEVTFVSGDITAVSIVNGVPGAVSWNSDLRYVSATNLASSSGSFTWYQLLAYFKPSNSGDGGDDVDAVFNGVNYKLMCPTTTHLMQGYIMAVDGGDYQTPYAHYAIIPWFGCVFPSS